MFVVQVGAHGHDDTSYKNTADVVPSMITQGSAAILVEPQRYFADRLRAKYSKCSNVTVFNEAVCAQNQTQATLFSVDVNNRPNFGSAHADGRCANKTIHPKTKSGFVTELATLSARQLQRQAYLLAYTPKQCNTCSMALNSSLPPDCMRDLIKKNTRASTVPCLSWAAVLPPGRSVDLLMIDVEGSEANVIDTFPFASNPVARVRFEAKHLTRASKKRVEDVLTRVGFRRTQRGGGDETWTRGART